MHIAILCISAVAICTGRVEAKLDLETLRYPATRCNLHGACGGKVNLTALTAAVGRCNLHGACGGKDPQPEKPAAEGVLQSARGVWRQSRRFFYHRLRKQLQSARGVWRQSKYRGFCRKTQCVAICTGRVEAKRISRRRKRPKRCCNLHGACGGKERLFRPLIDGVRSCNLHGACGRPCIIPRKKSEKIYADLLHFYSSWCIIHLVRQTDTK